MSSPNYHPSQQALRFIILGVGVNLCLAMVKMVSGYLGTTYALVADGIESLIDSVGSLVAWYGLKIAGKPPDADHPYGHGKAEPIAAALVCLFLFGAAIWIAVHSVHEIITPHHAPAPFTLFVLVGVVVIKEGLFHVLNRQGRQTDSIILKTDAWHHRGDALTSIAAFIGIAIALMGGPGYESADDWAALLASGVILISAYRLLRPTLQELSDASPASDAIELVISKAKAVPEVRGVGRCLVRKMGFDYWVDLDVMVDGDITVREGHKIAHSVEDAVRSANPRIAGVIVHVEPEREEEKNG